MEACQIACTKDCHRFTTARSPRFVQPAQSSFKVSVSRPNISSMIRPTVQRSEPSVLLRAVPCRKPGPISTPDSVFHEGFPIQTVDFCPSLGGTSLSPSEQVHWTPGSPSAVGRGGAPGQEPSALRARSGRPGPHSFGPEKQKLRVAGPFVIFFCGNSLPEWTGPPQKTKEYKLVVYR